MRNSIHPAIVNAAAIPARIAKYAVLGALAVSCGGVFIGTVIVPPFKPACAVEITMGDGNVYRPSVADTCAEAITGFDVDSIRGEWVDFRTVQVML